MVERILNHVKLSNTYKKFETQDLGIDVIFCVWYDGETFHNLAILQVENFFFLICFFFLNI